MDPVRLDKTEVELSENQTSPANDTNTRSGEPPVTFDLSPVEFLASWNTSAGGPVTQGLLGSHV